MRKLGKVIKHGGLNVWPHELEMADIFTAAGHTVEFIRPKDKTGEHTLDVLLDGKKWEFKSPKSSKMDAVERNLKRGTKQSRRIVFYSCRIKRIPDKAILRELTTKSHANKYITYLKFINSQDKIIDVNGVDIK